jgi:hypothetical protein
LQSAGLSAIDLQNFCKSFDYVNGQRHAIVANRMRCAVV